MVIASVWQDNAFYHKDLTLEIIERHVPRPIWAMTDPRHCAEPRLTGAFMRAGLSTCEVRDVQCQLRLHLPLANGISCSITRCSAPRGACTVPRVASTTKIPMAECRGRGSVDGTRTDEHCMYISGKACLPPLRPGTTLSSSRHRRRISLL